MIEQKFTWDLIQNFQCFFENLMTPDMNWIKIDMDHVRPMPTLNITDPEQIGKTSHF